MGQIKVEKNAGGIEGLCVIEPPYTVMRADILWRPTIRKIWKKQDLQ